MTYALTVLPTVDLRLIPKDSTRVPIGDYLDFNSYIENYRDSSVVGDHWLSVMTPDSLEFLIPEVLLIHENPVHGQIFGLHHGLIPNQLRIPSRADLGTYILIGRIGVYPDLVIDEDWFEFEVIP